MEQESKIEHSTEARLLAALAHASVMLQGIGLLVGVVVYVNQREKSVYAAFQGLQAAVYQLVAIIIVINVWLAWTIFYFLTFIPLFQFFEANPDGPLPPIFWIGLGSMLIPFAIMLVVGLYGLWGAFRVWRGKEFRYMLIGPWLARSGLWNKTAK